MQHIIVRGDLFHLYLRPDCRVVFGESLPEHLGLKCLYYGSEEIRYYKAVDNGAYGTDEISYPRSDAFEVGKHHNKNYRKGYYDKCGYTPPEVVFIPPVKLHFAPPAFFKHYI